MSLTTPPTALRRSDQAAMFVTIALAVLGVVATAWVAIVRLLEVLPGRTCRCSCRSSDETAPLPIGRDGAPVQVAVTQAIVTVPEPAAATQFALVAQPIVAGAATVAVIAAARRVRLERSLAAGHSAERTCASCGGDRGSTAAGSAQRRNGGRRRLGRAT